MKEIDVKKIFSKLRRKKDKKKAQSDWNARRDWSIVISLFLLCIVFTTLAHIYLFMQINREEIFSVKIEDDSKPKEIDTVKLENVIASYKEKEKEFDRLLTTKP